MSGLFTDFFLGIRTLFRRESVESEMNDELRFHVDCQTEKYVSSGLSREEAARRARIELGGLEKAREECRDARGTRLLETLVQDVRYALRMLRKNPGFTAVSIITLALGIGANAAIFSLMDAVLLSPLPVRNPEELVLISTADSESQVTNSFSYPMYLDLRDKNDAFAGVIARGGAQFNLNYRGVNEKVRGELVSGNYYDVLGVRPWIGRLFTQQDDVIPGGHAVVVISFGFWQRRFGSDPGVIGQTILLNEHPMTVVGVSPPGFYGTRLDSEQDVRVPLMMTLVFKPVPNNRMESRYHQWLDLMARYKPGIGMVQAQASVNVLFHQIIASEEHMLPADTTEFKRKRFLARRIVLDPGMRGVDSLQHQMSRPLLLLFAVTGIVLLILCANLANLSLARSAAREQEVAVRLALGAGRSRLVRQWLTESIALSFLGAIVGVLVAYWGKVALLSFVPADFRANLESPLGWRVFALLLVVAVAMGVLLGLAPALRASRSTLGKSLHLDSRTVASSGGVMSLRGGLILLQVALSLPLLVGAGLFLASLRNLEGMDTGFQKDNILLASLNPSLNGYPQDRVHALYSDILAQLRAQPGVRLVGLTTNSPISGGWDELSVVVEGYSPRQGEDMNPNWAAVSSGYFQSLGIPLLAGRDFTEQDGPGAPPVAIINETMARYFFKDGNPIGRKIGLEKVADTEIVGVVKDSKYSNLREKPPRHMYMPVAQQDRLFDLTLAVRTTGDPRAAVDLVRAATARVDAHLPIYDVITLQAQIDASLGPDRLIAWLSALFGIVATLLSAIGLYGVVAFSAGRRTREIGIRIALGAMPGNILDLVLRQTGYVVAAGLLLGAGVAFGVSRVVGSMLFGVSPLEPSVYLLAAFLLAAAAALAAYLPARRATRVDPVIALRYE
ncbi:MAG TPA: ABC transporter permease [Candidatus Acidoferrales bacterium]|nr:ABC transporter permease [Candidatus Acidoferrales bacterium]